MIAITINDLVDSQELDQNAMVAVIGGSLLPVYRNHVHRGHYHYRFHWNRRRGFHFHRRYHRGYIHRHRVPQI